MAQNPGYSNPTSDLPQTAERLYRAEIALEDARSSGIDAWIQAAAERLHEAVSQYLCELNAAH